MTSYSMIKAALRLMCRGRSALHQSFALLGRLTCFHLTFKDVKFVRRVVIILDSCHTNPSPALTAPTLNLSVISGGPLRVF